MSVMRGYRVLVALAASLMLASPASAEGLGEVVRRDARVSTADLLDPRPLPPTDIYRPGPSRRPKHRDLAIFAWLEFIALNAPAQLDPLRRGRPGGSFADSGFDPDATLVWETYQHRAELFPHNPNDDGAVPPRPFNENPPVYVFEPGASSGRPAFRVRAEPGQFNNLDEASQIGQNLLFYPSPRGRDVHQVLFQAKVNAVESRYVRETLGPDENGDNQAVLTIDPEQGTLEVFPTINFPSNIIEVKTAWLPIEAIPRSQRHRYHRSNVIFYEGTDDDPEAASGVYVLLSMHIIQKTPNYPAFIFATYEHEDLLIDPETREPRGVFYIPTYETIAYQLPETTTFASSGDVVDNPDIRFNVRRPVARPNRTRVALPVGPVEDNDGAIVVDDMVLVPVRQPPTTNREVAEANAQVLRAMQRIPGFDETFVWQYYRLKGVQGIPTSNERRKDYYLADIVIESSQPGIQLFRGGAKVDTSVSPVALNNPRNQTNVVDPAQGGKTFSVGGCQGCHGVAQTQAGFDFSFLIGGMNGRGFAPDTLGMQTENLMLNRADKYLLGPGGDRPPE